MLDRKMKDYEASVELLEDRKKTKKDFFIITLLFGAVYLICGLIVATVLIGPGIIICCGAIAILILGDMLHREFTYYVNIIFMIKKGLVQTKDKRE